MKTKFQKQKPKPRRPRRAANLPDPRATRHLPPAFCLLPAPPASAIRLELADIAEQIISGHQRDLTNARRQFNSLLKSLSTNN